MKTHSYKKTAQGEEGDNCTGLLLNVSSTNVLCYAGVDGWCVGRAVLLPPRLVETIKPPTVHRRNLIDVTALCSRFRLMRPICRICWNGAISWKLSVSWRHECHQTQNQRRSEIPSDLRSVAMLRLGHHSVFSEWLSDQESFLNCVIQIFFPIYLKNISTWQKTSSFKAQHTD